MQMRLTAVVNEIAAHELTAQASIDAVKEALT
jgi:hypothetical protein